MKVTRVIALGAVLAAACTAVPQIHAPGATVVRAPDLAHPITESSPAASRPADPVKAGVFDRINADRAAAGLAPVGWDEDAARVADAFCAAQIREGTAGHFLTDGLPPYARTGLTGIFGAPLENSVSWESSDATLERSTLELALFGQQEMMEETPPHDGHRQTILDPDVTHVGVGWAQEHGSFRMAQEFLTRGLARLTLEQAAESPATILVTGRVSKPLKLEFATLAREPEPRRLTKAQASSRTSYAYPKPHLGYVQEGRRSLHVLGTETADRIRLDAAGEFSFRFTPTLPGLWTILIYTSDGHAEPRPGGMVVLWIELAP